MIFFVLVSEMDLLIVVFTLLCGVVIEAKEFLRTGRGDDIQISGSSSEEDPSQTVALLILEHNRMSEESDELEESEESDQSFSYYKPKNLKPFGSITKLNDIDSSGDSNSDEYPNTDSEEDYVANIGDAAKIVHLIQEQPSPLRKRWKTCLKKAGKECTKACKASYENACDMQKCKSKLKKTLKKECKQNCKDFFS